MGWWTRGGWRGRDGWRTRAEAKKAARVASRREDHELSRDCWCEPEVHDYSEPETTGRVVKRKGIEEIRRRMGGTQDRPDRWPYEPGL